MAELTDQERKCEKSTAESYGGLSLGLFATALLPDALWQILSLVTLGALFALSGLYLILPCGWKRKGFPKGVALWLAKEKQVKYVKGVAWFIVLAVFGINLIQTRINWLVILGVICACLGYAILLFGIWKGSQKGNKQGQK